MNKRVSWTLAALIFSAASPAVAEGGLYTSVHLGFSQLGKQTIDSIDTGFGPQPGGYIDSDNGIGYGAAVGWDWDNGFRTEIEVNRHRNEFTQATAGALIDAETTGDGINTSVFVNVYYDLPRGQGCGECRLTPYIGAGIGKTWSRWDDVQSFNAGERVGHDSKDSATSAQVMLGVSYDLPRVEGLALTAELRYTKMLSDLHYNGAVLESRFGSFPIKTNVTSSDRTDIQFGLRYSF